MLIRVMDYHDRFRCLAGACPHTCCAGWAVDVDEETACRCLDLPGPLGERLRGALRFEEGGWTLPLEGGRCPMLEEGGLCQLHRKLGEAATPATCREHPRFTEDYGPFREIALSASCPAACALLLGSAAPLGFLERETAEPEEAGDPWLSPLLALRARLLGLVSDRRRPLRRRLGDALLLAAQAQERLDEDRAEDLPALAERWRPWEGTLQGPGLFPAAFHFLGTLEALDGGWRELLRQAETAPAGTVPAALLERIAAYFLFRYALKAVNDGDLLGRVQLCVLAVLTVERLAALTGLSEALRRFSREIEHSSENLEALLAVFWRKEALTLSYFLEELSMRAGQLCVLLG